MVENGKWREDEDRYQCLRLEAEELKRRTTSCTKYINLLLVTPSRRRKFNQNEMKVMRRW